MSETDKKRNGILKRLLVLFFGLALLGSVLVLAFPATRNKESDAPVRNYSQDILLYTDNFREEQIVKIASMPKVPQLEFHEPAPEPLQENFSDYSYKDDYTEVVYWKEYIDQTTVHFAEIKISHPSQLRTAWAGHGLESAVLPELSHSDKIAKAVNAVVAINFDLASFRQNGVILRQGEQLTEYFDYNHTQRWYQRSNYQKGWSTLLIDRYGDFKIMPDTAPELPGLLASGDIINTAAFGPSLIVDGEISYNLEDGCGKGWNMSYSPRTAIGQIGPLHYLFFICEGRTDSSTGLFTPRVAEIMKEKGCVQAYNLDGGHSVVMIINGEIVNNSYRGWFRGDMADIVYIATLNGEE